MIKLEKIIEYGLYLAVFLLPIQTRWIFRPGLINGGYLEYLSLSLYAIDLLLLALFVLFFALKVKQKTSFASSKLKRVWLLIVALDIWYFLTIFFSANQALAWQKYIWFLLSVVLFCLILESRYSQIKLVASLLSGAFVQALLAIWHFIEQKTLAFKWLGLSEHTAYDLGHSVIETIQGGRWLRAYGGLDHPNILAAYLLIALLILIYFYIFFQAQGFVQKRNRLVSMFMICAFSLGIFFSFSRSTWLALSALLPLALVLLWQDKARRKLLVKIIILISSVFLIFSFIFSDITLTRLGAEGRLEKKSNNERLESLVGARNIIKDNWCVGVGAGSYTLILTELQAGRDAWEYQPTHNTVLLVTAELGVVGAFLYFVLIFYVLLKLIKTRKQGSAFLTLPLLALLIISLFDHWLFSLHFGFLLFWLVLGISVRALKEKN